MKQINFKDAFIKVIIGGVVGAAGIAVVAVLIGEFNDTLGRALLTLALVTIHALVSLSYMERKDANGNMDFSVFSNVIFSMIVMSFFSSIALAWGAIDIEQTFRIYVSYGIIAFATLHAEILAETMKKDKTIDNLVIANYFFMFLVVVLLLPWVLIVNIALPDIYFRLMAAFGIIDTTLTILVAVFQRLYLQKHPKEDSFMFQTQIIYDSEGKPVKVPVAQRKRSLNPAVAIILIYLTFQFLLPILFLFGSFLSN